MWTFIGGLVCCRPTSEDEEFEWGTTTPFRDKPSPASQGLLDATAAAMTASFCANNIPLPLHHNYHNHQHYMYNYYVYWQVKLPCDPCLSAMTLCLHSKWRYINTLPFLYRVVNKDVHTSFFLAPAVTGLRAAPADIVIWFGVDVGGILSWAASFGSDWLLALRLQNQLSVSWFSYTL